MEKKEESQSTDPVGHSGLRALYAGWKETSDERVSSVCEKLRTGGTRASEELLQREAAFAVVFMEGLEEAEVAVVKQLGLLAQVGSHKNAPLLARVLSDLSKVRTETSQRATDLLKAAEELAARREVLEAEKSAVRPLRRVV